MKKPLLLLFSLLAGAIAGVLLHPWASTATMQAALTHIMAPAGQLFLRILLMSVLPLILSGLILGVHELGSTRGGNLRRTASKTIFYTVVTSAASVLIGVILVNWLKPGLAVQVDGIASGTNGAVADLSQKASQAKPVMQALVELIPRNPVEAAARAFDGEIVALMVFALIFGWALSKAENTSTKPVLIMFLEQVFAASMKIVDMAMLVAPIGVFALTFGTVVKFGPTIFLSLGLYVTTVVVALLIQQFVTYSILLKIVGRKPWEFFRTCREVYLYAFATASSNATLPRTLQVAEGPLRIPRDVSRFVLTVGSSANQNGTALFEGVTVLFLAQLYGIDLTLGSQITVVVMSIVAGIGTAGVPGGSLPLVMVLMQQVGIPAEGIGIILGVDRFLDMCRTTINVSGDLVIAAIVGCPKSQRAGLKKILRLGRRRGGVPAAG